MSIIREGNKIRITKRTDINLSKLFTKNFFVSLGMHPDEVIVRRLNAHNTLSVDLTLPSIDNIDNIEKKVDDVRIPDNNNTVIKDLPDIQYKDFVLPDPANKHIDQPITMSDFEIPRPIKGGSGNFLSTMGNFFSGFLYKSKLHDDHPLKTSVDDLTNTDLEVIFKPKHRLFLTLSLADMEKNKGDVSPNIFQIPILGGVEYKDLEALSSCLDKQIEYMDAMGVQITEWRKEYIYKIGDVYVCMDVSKIQDKTQDISEVLKIKKELMRGIIGLESPKLRGLRES